MRSYITKTYRRVSSPSSWCFVLNSVISSKFPNICEVMPLCCYSSNLVNWSKVYLKLKERKRVRWKLYSNKKRHTNIPTKIKISWLPEKWGLKRTVAQTTATKSLNSKSTSWPKKLRRKKCVRPRTLHCIVSNSVRIFLL